MSADFLLLWKIAITVPKKEQAMSSYFPDQLIYSIYYFVIELTFKLSCLFIVIIIISLSS